MSLNWSILQGLFYPLSFILICLALYHYWQQSTRYVRLGRKLPGPKPIPLFGNALEALLMKPDDIAEYVLNKSKTDFKNNTIVGIWLGYKLYVGIINPEDVEIILGSQTHIQKSEEYRYFKPWLGDGLLISRGEKWKNHRKIIAPTFHIHILKTFINSLNNNGSSLVKRLENEISNNFDIHDYMSRVTVDTLLETVMGIEKPKNETTSFDYANAVLKLCTIIHNRHYKYWLQNDFIFKLTSLAGAQTHLINVIHSLRNKIVKFKTEGVSLKLNTGESNSLPISISDNGLNDQGSNKNFYSFGSAVRDDLDEADEIGEKKRRPFLEELIETKLTNTGSFTDEEINEEVDTILFEGHDTTAAAMSFVLSLLGIHQAIQEKVFQELNAIFYDSERSATFEDTVQMKYLERVILESLRLYPPVPMIARKLTEDVCLASERYVLPKGTTVVIGTYLLHRRPELYENPDVFDPDNFLAEKCVGRHHYSYIPFSAGPRSCVGRKYAMLKMKIILSSILRKYKVYSDISEKAFRLQGDIILKRADGFKIRIENRLS
ncbi:cytochrome P450 4g15-like [Agrilus planipennis]|uniref:Cytochrome P450 4g15-like n=1 Tax=Agrilus planipennis TaxID=224129 RepID=A0A1W4X3U9_AGRPL|nr:cytochrome P450 4g15-like [Agrilus planipennis]XP_018327477.1 cytochrome P450 4g15-like [Agrilus planipennis]